MSLDPVTGGSAGEAVAAWSEALDLFEERLAGFRSAVDPDGRPPDGLWPPSELIGRPLPPELARRARDLLAQAKAIEGELVARRTELPPAHKAPVRHRRRPSGSTFSAAL